VQNGERKVVELNILDVLPNRFQPRIKFDENAINELALSIKKYGVIQPIVVRKIGDKYEIIAGERRYKASVLAGKQTIPAIVSELSDIDSVEVALIENVQREDLTPIEKAISYKKILDMGYITQEELAKKVGKSQSSIANTLRLLNLCEEVQEALLENKISERHARSLLKIKDEQQQEIMLNRIIEERLTVRKTDEEIEKMNNGESKNFNEELFNPILEEVVTIPDTPEIEDSIMPGFLDINKIETEAKDIMPEVKPLADMNDLLQPSTPAVEQPAEEPLMPQGKFFNFFDDTNSFDNSDVGFGNFFDNQTNLVENAEPTVEPEIPSFEPMMPTMEPTVQPEMPSYEPMMPTMEPTVEPEIPSYEPMMPTMEPTVEPEMPSYEPMMPTMEPTVEPEIPSYEPMMPTMEPAVEPEMPSFEPMMPTMEPTLQPEATMFDSIMPLSEDQLKPEMPTSIPETNTPTTIKVATQNIRLALNTIRECENTLNQYGFVVEVEEIDLEDSYQVIFKITK